MKAATTSNVLQFSFLTSSGFRGVPRTKSTHAAQDADCWDQHGQQYRSGYQRFATIVNAVSVFSPESGTLVNRAQTRVVEHLVYSRQALLEGAYFEAGCIRALPEPCVARSRIEVNWDFELLRSPDVGPCIAPRCESIHVAAAAESKPDRRASVQNVPREACPPALNWKGLRFFRKPWYSSLAVRARAYVHLKTVRGPSVIHRVQYD